MGYELGIIGGVGSEASAYLYDKILKRCRVSNDQDHINMVILNHAEIPDRTAYILNHDNKNPLNYFLSDLKILNQLKVKLILIPCNTSHYFFDAFQESSEAPILHMIASTIKELKKQNVKKVGIFATDGTISSNLYQKYCDLYGIDWVIPSFDNQKKVMSLIYDDIKQGKPIQQHNLDDIVDEMLSQGVEKMILACTELSILKEKKQLDDRFIDPLDIVVDYTLKFFNKEKK